MNLMEEALRYFRCLVPLLYREVGVLTQHIHPALAAKAKLNGPFFKDTKGQAKLIYRETKMEKRTVHILKRYEQRSGLSLDDVHRAFAEGKWPSYAGNYLFGGPNWARIAMFTQQLQLAIDKGDQDRAAELLREIQTLPHNNGKIVEKFHELD